MAWSGPRDAVASRECEMPRARAVLCTDVHVPDACLRFQCARNGQRTGARESRLMCLSVES